VVAAFADLLSSRDGELLQDQRYASAFEETMHEALRQGTSGAGWDNVSWIGRWDIDLSAIRCPVRLWYGSDDPLAAPAHGGWLSENLPQARLVLRDGEGHLGIYEHLLEMLDALTEPEAAGPPGTVRPQLRGAAADIRYPAIEADSDYQFGSARDAGRQADAGLPGHEDSTAGHDQPRLGADHHGG
jgi:hypothetical protein